MRDWVSARWCHLAINYLQQNQVPPTPTPSALPPSFYHSYPITPPPSPCPISLPLSPTVSHPPSLSLFHTHTYTPTYALGVSGWSHEQEALTVQRTQIEREKERQRVWERQSNIHIFSSFWEKTNYIAAAELFPHCYVEALLKSKAPLRYFALGTFLFLIQINWDIPYDMLPSFPQESCLSSECSLNVQGSSCSLIKAVAVLQREWLSTEEPGLLARVGQLWRSIERKKRENCSRKHKGKKENKKQTNIKYCFGTKWISLLLGVSTCFFKSLLALVLIRFSLFFTLFYRIVFSWDSLDLVLDVLLMKYNLVDI